MKVKIEFEYDTNDLDQETEFKDMLKGKDYKMALYEYAQWLRSNIKYDNTLSEDTYNTFVKAQEYLFELLNESDIKIYE